MNKPLARIVVLLIALGLPLAARSADAPATPAGQVKTSSGAVHIERGGLTLAAPAGATVLVGDRVRTGASGYVGVTLRDDTTLSAGPDSMLLIHAFEYQAEAGTGSMLVSLLQGTFRVVTGLIARIAPQAVEFRTPTASLGIRGTDFIVDVPGAAH